ncbi:MAG: type III pantothenate kinase [Bacteroidales bacterium]|nr:type III pantothenate kinase [Bacteroidales bacterium]
MRYLCADIGNTHVKLGFYVDGKLSCQASFLLSDAVPACEWIGANAMDADGAILAASGAVPERLEQAVRSSAARYERLTADTPIPIENRYRTPRTLGPDRLAAAVGAYAGHGGQPLLVVDAGTAITFDTVTASGAYLGGTISPGLQMRFEALHHYAERLPLVTPGEQEGLVGRTTAEAIALGVQNGILAEIDYYVREFGSIFGKPTVVLTGGDMIFLMNRLKNTAKYIIFAERDLVLDGLHSIIRGIVSPEGEKQGNVNINQIP